MGGKASPLEMWGLLGCGPGYGNEDGPQMLPISLETGLFSEERSDELKGSKKNAARTMLSKSFESHYSLLRFTSPVCLVMLSDAGQDL
jgi:hypothetical protein